MPACDWCGEPAKYKQEVKPVSSQYAYACPKHKTTLENSIRRERSIKITRSKREKHIAKDEAELL